MVIECCRQFQAFTLSLSPFSPKSRWLKPPSSQFFSQLPVLNENPGLICNDIYFFDFLVYIFLVLYFDIVLITQFSFWLLRNYLLINYMYQSICIYLYLSVSLGRQNVTISFFNKSKGTTFPRVRTY